MCPPHPLALIEMQTRRENQERRDRAADLAMEAITRRPGPRLTAEEVAREAYAIADAMEAEREKGIAR